MTSEITDPVAYFRRLIESEGLDIAPCTSVICHKNSGMGHYPHIFDVYANVGLHRYNMLKGINLRLSRVIKYKRLMNCLSPYWITLVATNIVSGSDLEFEVTVVEQK